MRVSALSQAQRQVLDVLGPLSVARGGLGVGLVPADLTREAMCVGGLLDVWPWLARVARDFNLPHLQVALNQWDPAEEVGEGAAAGAGEAPPLLNPLRGRTARLNSLVDTVMTAISKYGRLVQEGKQDNFGMAGFPSPLLPLVPEADVPPRYGMVWDTARTSELLGSPAEKAARMELCGGATEPWRLEVKDLRAWVTRQLAGEQPAPTASQAVIRFLEGAAGGHNQSHVTALAERVQVERLLWDASSPLAHDRLAPVDAVTREYAGVARATIRAARSQGAGSWLHAPLSVLSRVQPEDARGMFCQRLAIPQPCSCPPQPLGATHGACGEAWRVTQICPGCRKQGKVVELI